MPLPWPGRAARRDRERNPRRNRAFRPTVGDANGTQRLEPRVVLSNLPDGFAEFKVATGLSNPTSLDVAPDGRVFITEQGGAVRIVKDGRLLPEPFLTLPVEASSERGLECLVLDPHFEDNGYVYLYYTDPGTPLRNRVVRFTAHGDAADPNSAFFLLDLEPLGHGLHNGGAMHFGPDGKLYVAVGDGYVNQDKAQSLDSFFGKILRLNPDGSIPADNPFFNVAQGPYRAIYALGFRNPFTFGFDPHTGRLFVNDVGLDNFEEINDVVPGGNYGWPLTEGVAHDPRFLDPLYAYPHNGPDGFAAAIVGGTFYRPDAPQFPPEYDGLYFFHDFIAGWLKTLDPRTGAVSTFATDFPQFPIDLDVAPDGALYFLTRGVGVVTTGDTGGALYRIEYPEGLKQARIVTPPADEVVAVGAPAVFQAVALGEEPLSYQWQRDQVDIPGANGSVLLLPTTTLGDDGALFRLIVRNDSGAAISPEARLTVASAPPPRVQVLTPNRPRVRPGIGRIDPRIVFPGETVRLVAQVTDPRTRRPAPGLVTFRVDLHHNTHAHPLVPDTVGPRSLDFSVPTDIHENGDIWYRVYVTVKAPSGLTSTTTLDLVPTTSPLVFGLLGGPRASAFDHLPRPNPRPRRR